MPHTNARHKESTTSQPQLFLWRDILFGPPGALPSLLYACSHFVVLRSECADQLGPKDHAVEFAYVGSCSMCGARAQTMCSVTPPFRHTAKSGRPPVNTAPLKTSPVAPIVNVRMWPSWKSTSLFVTLIVKPVWSSSQ